MYDLQFLKPTGKEIALAILGVVIFLVVVFSAGYLLGVERTKDVYDNGAGVADVGNQLEQAGTNISNAEAGIEAAAGHADQVASGIESAKESANYIEGAAATSTELIGQCQSIIERIRSRGTAQTK